MLLAPGSMEYKPFAREALHSLNPRITCFDWVTFCTEAPV